MDDLKKTHKEEKNTTIEQIPEVPEAQSDDNLNNVTGGVESPLAHGVIFE